MDNTDIKKDIKKTDTILARFVDTSTIRTDPFGENKMGSRAYRRAERITAALHVLTNHINESEPLRISIREKSTGLLSDVLGTVHELRIQNSLKVQRVESTVRSLISLVRMLAISNYISFQNADIATEALDDLGMFISSSNKSPLSDSVTILKEDFLSVHYTQDKQEKIIKDTKEFYKTPSPEIKNDNILSTPFVHYNQTVTPTTSTRSANILGTLRENGAMGIRDIVANLPEYSEKMIQRELADMVSKSVLLKEGEKRWSKYLIPQ